jgi:hypothetical protein
MQLRSDVEERRQAAQRRINTLKEVIEKIKNGEEVDLRKELGTGNPQAEKEWQDVVDQIPDDAFWMEPKVKKNKKAKAAASNVAKFSDESKKSGWSLPFFLSDKSSSKSEVPAAAKTSDQKEQPVRRAFY